ncbi:hypothetical protein C8R44DRAFT_878219 [Mycena epipterygia]|nr:hypothetical protein C8R44DRAFT_878219 [Mycena epipterygia]
MPPPPNIRNNCCPICTNHLTPKQRKKDNVWYLKCYNPAAHASEGGRTYYFYFAPEDSPEKHAGPADSSPQPAGPSTTTKRCPEPDCNGRVNRDCANQKCKKHCLAAGRCSYSRHADTSTSTSTSSTAASSSILPSRASAASTSAFTSYDDIRQSVLAPLRQLDAYQREQAMAAQHLDNLYGVKSPPPDDELQPVEEDELAVAIRRSAREAQQMERRRRFEQLAQSVSKCSPPPAQACFLLRQLSPSPDLPSSISLNKRLSDVDDFTLSMRPQTPYLSRHAPSLSRSMKRTPPSLSELAQQRFPLVSWSEDGKPAVTKMIQNCPDWPIWIRGVEGDPYECYSFQYQTWMTVPYAYKHCIATDTPIFIRRLGVVGSDEAEQLRRFTKGKRKAEVIEIADDDDEVVVVDYKPAAPRPSKRPHLTVEIPDFWTEHDIPQFFPIVFCQFFPIVFLLHDHLFV